MRGTRRLVRGIAGEQCLQLCGRPRLLWCSLQGNSRPDWIGGFGCWWHIRRGQRLVPVMLDNDRPCAPEGGLLDVYADQFAHMGVALEG